MTSPRGGHRLKMATAAAGIAKLLFLVLPAIFLVPLMRNRLSCDGRNLTWKSLIEEKGREMSGLWRRIVSLLFVLILVVGAMAVSGCKKGPGEKAGEKVDKAVEKTGEAVEKAGEAVQDAAK